MERSVCRVTRGVARRAWLRRGRGDQLAFVLDLQVQQFRNGLAEVALLAGAGLSNGGGSWGRWRP